MSKKHFSLVTMFSLLLLVSGVSLAQETVGTRFGIGFQASFPAWGLSGTLDITEKVAVQGIFGMFGDLRTYAGRALYRFKREEYWHPYGYGTVGAWQYTGWDLDPEDYWDLKETTETVMGFGAGVGIEYNWQAWSSNLPPLWWNLEVGFARVEFEEVDFNLSTFSMGVGTHFRF